MPSTGNPEKLAHPVVIAALDSLEDYLQDPDRRESSGGPDPLAELEKVRDWVANLGLANPGRPADQSRCPIPPEQLSGSATNVLEQTISFDSKIADGPTNGLEASVHLYANSRFDDGAGLDQILRELEAEVIAAALRACDLHRSRAAKVLRMSRSRLYRRISELGHPPPRRPQNESSEVPDEA